jgi:hypothetical protein
LIGDDADPRLEHVWHEERLPIVSLAAGLEQLETNLETIGTATVVACGLRGAEAAALAAKLGFRTFLIGEHWAPNGARLANLSEVLEAGRAARSRERWKASRSVERP